MELRHLRTFLLAVEEMHFGRAARRLHVTQPAVSQTIAALESQVGTPLFDRTRRRIELTPAGEIFADEARHLLVRLERASHLARCAAQGEVGRLRLALTAVSSLSVIPAAITTFRKLYPRVEIQIEQKGTTAQVDDLLQQRCDLGFSVLTGEVAPVSTETLTKEPLLAFLPEKHRLAGRRSVHFRDIAGEPVLLMSRRTEPAMHLAYEGLCRLNGCEPQVALELDYLEAMLSFVAAGAGVSLAPAAVRRLQLAGVVGVPLQPRIAAGVSILWSPSHLSAPAAKFLAHLRQHRDKAAHTSR